MSLEDLHRRAAEICTEVFAGEAVENARAEYEKQVERVALLKTAQARLVRQSKELSQARKELAAQLEDRLIESQTAGSKVSSIEGLKRLAQLDAEHRLTTLANSKILERLLPRAEILSLECASAHFRSQADALRVVAEDRLRKTTEMMADAAQHEGSIVFDPSQTLSGVLHQYADELDKQAANHRTWAQQRAEDHERLIGETIR